MHGSALQFAKFHCHSSHPILSTKSQMTFGEGIKGDPSYNTTEAPTARADTSQFHIIQPVYWDQCTMMILLVPACAF